MFVAAFLRAVFGVHICTVSVEKPCSTRTVTNLVRVLDEVPHEKLGGIITHVCWSPVAHPGQGEVIGRCQERLLIIHLNSGF